MKKILDYIALKLALELIKQIGLDGFRVAVLDVQPGDVIAVKTNEEIPDKAWEDIKARLLRVFPNNPIILMLDQVDLVIVREQEKEKQGG